MSEALLQLIRTRRVIRDLTEQPVEREQLVKVLDAGRWAPCGGNMRVHRFVVIQDPVTLRLLRMVSPGMFQRPPALILICIDWDRVAESEIPAHDPVLYVDVGTAMENMLLAAHAMGLGSGPVTSFSREAVRVILNLPSNLTPVLFVCLGHPRSQTKLRMRAQSQTSWQGLTDWERYEDQEALT